MIAAYPSPESFDARVLHLLKAGRRLSVMDAIQEFGIPSLRECVYRLRRAGFPIIDQWKHCTGDDYRPNRYKEFFIETQSNPKPGGGI